MANRCRRFTVLDAIILIAAIAVGFAWTRHFQNSEAGRESYPDSIMTDLVSALRLRIEILYWWATGLTYTMAAVTIGLLILRLGGCSRKRLRYLTRFPGAVAGGAVLLTVMCDLTKSAILVLIGVTSGRPYSSIFPFTYLLVSINNAGVAVATTWALLAVSGRWRREPGWLDGAGFALGLYWLFHLLFGSFMGIIPDLPV